MVLNSVASEGGYVDYQSNLPTKLVQLNSVIIKSITERKVKYCLVACARITNGPRISISSYYASPSHHQRARQGDECA